MRHFPVKVHSLGPRYGRYNYAPRYVAWLDANVHRFDVIVFNEIAHLHIDIATGTAFHAPPFGT